MASNNESPTPLERAALARDQITVGVADAVNSGMRTCWINRRGEAWPAELPPPDLHFDTLAGLADWLDSRHPHLEDA